MRAFAILLALVVGSLYAITLQRDINGSNNRYMEDVGEFQNVLAQWGTAHSPGYPLYSLTGATFVSLANLVGINPTAGASLFSALSALLTYLGLYYLLGELKVSPPLSALACLLLAVTQPYWVHGSVAEVYALLMGFIVLAHVLALGYRRDPRPWRLYMLLTLFAFAVGHHPLAAMALPGLSLMVGPLALRTLHERPTRLFPVFLCTLAPWLLYLYLPLRGWMGAAWVYGRPDTWDGFWWLVSAREFESLLRLTTDPRVLADGLANAMTTLAGDLTWGMLIAGIAGFVVSLPTVWPFRKIEPAKQDTAAAWLALSCMALVVSNIGFASFYPRAVFLSATLMPALLGLVVGVALLAQWVATQGAKMLSGTGRAAGVGLAGLGLGVASAWLVIQNGPFVRSLTQDTYGRQRIELTASAGLQPPDPILVAAWGRDFFALSYGKFSGVLPPLRLVDHRANMAELVESGRPVYVVSPTLYTLGLDWWRERLGRVYLNGYPGELVRVTNTRLYREADAPQAMAPVVMGPITLRDWEVEPREGGRAWRLTVYWHATERIRQDYSVFVHLSDRESFDGPDAIIAQADRAAPVYGWFPTSRWLRDDIIRDDYLIAVPDGKTARRIAVGLYLRDPSGAFQNLGRAELPLPGQ